MHAGELFGALRGAAVPAPLARAGDLDSRRRARPGRARIRGHRDAGRLGDRLGIVARRPDAASSSSSSWPEACGRTASRGRWSCSPPTSSAASIQATIGRPAAFRSGRALGAPRCSSRSTGPRRRSSSRPRRLVPATISKSGCSRPTPARSLAQPRFVVGPAVAGVVAAATNPGSVFVVDSATFAVSATSLALLRLSRGRREGERRSSFADLKAAGWLPSLAWLGRASPGPPGPRDVVAPWMTLGPIVATECGRCGRVGADRARWGSSGSSPAGSSPYAGSGVRDRC